MRPQTIRALYQRNNQSIGRPGDLVARCAGCGALKNESQVTQCRACDALNCARCQEHHACTPAMRRLVRERGVLGDPHTIATVCTGCGAPWDATHQPGWEVVQTVDRMGSVTVRAAACSRTCAHALVADAQPSAGANEGSYTQVGRFYFRRAPRP